MNDNTKQNTADWPELVIDVIVEGIGISFTGASPGAIPIIGTQEEVYNSMLNQFNHHGMDELPFPLISVQAWDTVDLKVTERIINIDKILCFGNSWSPKKRYEELPPAPQAFGEVIPLVTEDGHGNGKGLH